MAEEHRCEAQETHRLCVNNCGFFGSPTTQNLCSKCYRDLRLKEDQASSVKIAVEKSLSASSSSPSPPFTTFPLSFPAVSLPVTTDPQRPSIVANLTTPSDESPEPAPTQPNRCSTCRKRVGLTGFRCRCGTTFCSTHRYPEQHGCTFDFKAVGREAIAKANPVVKAEKLEKI